MYETQSQMWNVMMGAATSFAAAWTSAAETNLALQREFLRTWSDDPPDQRQSNADQPAFTAFEFPKQGRSWYRAPFEHPVLAFWDQMLQPWRTYWPGTLFHQMPIQPSAFGVDPGRSPSIEAMNVALSFAPWMSYWADPFANPQWSFQPLHSPQNGTAESAANSTPQVMAGFAIAKVRFADDTEVTMTIPLIAPFFAASFLPVQSPDPQDRSK